MNSGKDLKESIVDSVKCSVLNSVSKSMTSAGLLLLVNSDVRAVIHETVWSESWHSIKWSVLPIPPFPSINASFARVNIR